MDRNEENLLVLWILLLRRVTSNRVYCKVNTIKKIMKKKKLEEISFFFSRTWSDVCSFSKKKKWSNNSQETWDKRGEIVLKNRTEMNVNWQIVLW